MNRYRLVRDTDFHWYVIPADKLKKWNEFLGSEEYELGDIPSWAEGGLGSPENVTFENYEIV